MVVVFLVAHATEAMTQNPLGVQQEPPPNVQRHRGDAELGGTISVEMPRVTVVGDSIVEMIWSGLRSFGFTHAQAAGIMGNIVGESGANPVRHEIGRDDPIRRGFQERAAWSGASRAFWKEQHPMKTTERTPDGKFDLFGNADVSYGVGLVQWSYGRRVGFMNHVRKNAPNLVRYFQSPEIYSVSSGNAFIEIADNIADARRLVELNLEYLIHEMANRTPRRMTESSVPRDSAGNPAPTRFPDGATELAVMKKIESPEHAAEFFLFSFERPASTLVGTGGTFSSYREAANRRANYGRVYYENETLRNIVPPNSEDSRALGVRLDE